MRTVCKSATIPQTPLSTEIVEIEAHSSFESGKRALVLAHALRASHSGGSPWVEHTRNFEFIF